LLLLFLCRDLTCSVCSASGYATLSGNVPCERVEKELKMFDLFLVG
jgi:hypothetical protein